MGQVLFVVAVAVAGAALVFGVTTLIMGSDKGLEPAEPDGGAVPLTTVRPLDEADLGSVKFDVVLRGYRMDQVDQALTRAAYDIGYKQELIGVLAAEVEALRAGHTDEADLLRQTRLAAVAPAADPGNATTGYQDTTDSQDTTDALDDDAPNTSAPDDDAPDDVTPNSEALDGETPDDVTATPAARVGAARDVPAGAVEQAT